MSSPATALKGPLTFGINIHSLLRQTGFLERWPGDPNQNWILEVPIEGATIQDAKNPVLLGLYRDKATQAVQAMVKDLAIRARVAQEWFGRRTTHSKIHDEDHLYVEKARKEMNAFWAQTMAAWRPGAERAAKEEVKKVQKDLGAMRGDVRAYEAAAGLGLLAKGAGIASGAMEVATLNPAGLVLGMIAIARNAIQLGVEIHNLWIDALTFGLKLNKDVGGVLVERWKKEEGQAKHGQATLEVFRSLSAKLVGYDWTTIDNCKGRLKQYRSKLQAVELRAVDSGPDLEQILEDTEAISARFAELCRSNDLKMRSLREEFEKTNAKVFGQVMELLGSIEKKMQWARFGLDPGGLAKPSIAVQQEILALKTYRGSLARKSREADAAYNFTGDRSRAKEAKRLDKQVQDNEVPPNVYDLQNLLEELEKSVPNWAGFVSRWVVPLAQFVNLAEGGPLTDPVLVDSAGVFVEYLGNLTEKLKYAEPLQEGLELGVEIGEGFEKGRDLIEEIAKVKG